MKRLPKLTVIALVGLLLALSAATTAHARTYRFTLRQGSGKVARMRRQITSARVEVNGSAVSARDDRQNSRLSIRGVRAGQATVTFSGTYRRIEVGSKLRDLNVPFSDTIHVTVEATGPANAPLPTDIRRLPRASAFRRAPGQTRSVHLKFVLGTSIWDAWWKDQNLRIVSEHGNVATARLIRSTSGRPLKLAITGRAKGLTRIAVSGDRRVGDKWRHTVRVFYVQVR